MSDKRDVPDAEDLDWQTVADLLQEWDAEWFEDGEDWIDPGMWWHQRISRLQLRCATRAKMERLGLIDRGQSDE